jgi:hypothetical protein
MSTSKEILPKIEKAFAEKVFDSRDSIIRIGPHETYILQWRSEDVSLKGELIQHDTIGVVLNSLSIEKTAQQDLNTAEYLRSVAQAIESRVNYLMEPLRILELDTTNNVVQMRSEKPELTEGAVSYFELLLKSGKWFGHSNHLSLQRYSQTPDNEGSRKTVGFPLTKKQFERLLDDLTELL